MEHKISNELPPLPTEQLGTAMSPTPEQHMPESMTEKQSQQAIETGTAQPVANTTYQQTPVQASTPPQTDVQVPMTPLPTADPQVPIIADDSDLIEKEWVLKAKEIVARTKHDPYQQNKEVERMKADYMKKRYNKDIKITED